MGITATKAGQQDEGQEELTGDCRWSTATWWLGKMRRKTEHGRGAAQQDEPVSGIEQQDGDPHSDMVCVWWLGWLRQQAKESDVLCRELCSTT